jgi:hypothetical protein
MDFISPHGPVELDSECLKACVNASLLEYDVCPNDSNIQVYSDLAYLIEGAYLATAPGGHRDNVLSLLRSSEAAQLIQNEIDAFLQDNVCSGLSSVWAEWAKDNHGPTLMMEKTKLMAECAKLMEHAKLDMADVKASSR